MSIMDFEEVSGLLPVCNLSFIRPTSISLLFQSLTLVTAGLSSSCLLSTTPLRRSLPLRKMVWWGAVPPGAWR